MSCTGNLRPHWRRNHNGRHPGLQRSSAKTKRKECLYMVYVLDKNGHPLMPTSRHGKVHRMLISGQAKVVKKCPFTIQLLYESEHNVQPVSLGIDAGSKHIGVSATTKTTVLYEADVELRDDIVKLLATRRQMRSSRRSRKTRYRPKRFDNRRRGE